MSKALREAHNQPFHGLRYMESSFGQSVPLLEFFEHVFDMNEDETKQLFQDCAPPDAYGLGKLFAERAELSLRAELAKANEDKEG